MAGELIPLAFQPTVAAIDPLAAAVRVSQLRGLENSNLQFEDRRNALLDYNRRQGAGDPNAIDALNTQPTEMGQVIAARTGQATENRAKFDFATNRRARAAQAVMAHPAGSPQRQEAWNSELADMLREGTIDQNRFNQLYGQPPNEQILQQYAAAARTVSEQDKLNTANRTRDALGRVALSVREAFAPSTPNEARLNQNESGGDFTRVNQLGYAGRQQFGAPRLADLGVYTPGSTENLDTWSRTGRGAPGKWTGSFNIPGHPEVKTLEDFRASPAAQATVEDMHRQRREGEIAQNGLDRYIGRNVGNTPITQNGLMNALHLGGVKSTRRFLESGGRDNPADANGTRISDYIRLGARSGGAAANAAPVPGQQVAAVPPATTSDGAPAPGVAAAPRAPTVPPLVQTGGGMIDPFERLVPAASELLLTPGLDEGAREWAKSILTSARENSKATEETKNFEAENRDRVARGLPELDRTSWDRSRRREAANQTTIDNRAESELEKRRGAGLGDRLNELAKAGDDAYTQRALVGRLGNMLERSDTNASVAFANYVRANFGESVAKLFGNKQTLSDAEAADALINYLKPRMRVAGTGASSDRDLEAFGKAIPSLMSTQAGRRMVINTLGGVQQSILDKSEIATRWQTKEIDEKTAMEQIRKSTSDPFESFREWQGSKEGKAGVAPPDLPIFNSIEEAKAALGSGKLGYSTAKETVQYQLRDGRVGVTPTYEEIHGRDR